jgi:glutathione S-transferase
MRVFDVASSFLASGARGGFGMSVGTLGARPTEPLVLYEFEACPFCRKVREALSVLDLDAEIRPCPKGGTRFRPELVARGGKAQFPYLVDSGAGVELYESDAIVTHLYTRYGDGRVPLALRGPIVGFTAPLASGARPGHGRQAAPSRAPTKPLDLWSFEASPYCRLVRERLCELELPYHLHNVAKGSPKRPAYLAMAGRMMVPYLRDDNTGVGMLESADILAYLDKTYAGS